jgi:hypothetical protein
VGAATGRWLQAQSQKEQASRIRQTQSGPVMTAVHQRYVDSFKSKIEPTPLRARQGVKD